MLAEPTDRETRQAARQNAAQQSYRNERVQEVQHRVSDVWSARKSDCTCCAEAIRRPSQGDKDYDCPYCICDDEGGDIPTVTTKCQNEEECAVCMLMNKLDEPILTALGMKRNERLSAMLELAPSIAESLNSGDVPEDRRRLLSEAFCDLLSCSRTKLRFVANVGFLAMICPNLRHLHLKKGWGDVWCNLSKVASAVGHHGDQRSQVAALMYVRQRCIAENNKWLWFLQSKDLTQERRIEQEVFQAGRNSDVDNSSA